MKATGIVRRIDDLGRVVIPKEIRPYALRMIAAIGQYMKDRIEAPEEEAERATEILRFEMEHAVSLKVPMLAEVHQGKDWFTAKG